MPSINDEILALEARRRRAIAAGEVGALERITSEHYVHIDISGQIRNRDTFLAILSGGHRRYSAYDIEDVDVIVKGEIAIVTGLFRNRGMADDGTSIAAAGRFIRIYALEARGWVNILHQGVPVRE